MPLNKNLNDYLNSLKHNGLYRQRHIVANDLLNFSDNDYLSLRNDITVRQFYQQGCASYPIGSGGSMLVAGYHSIHLAVERAFAEALQVESCVLLSSGYTANLAIMALLAKFNANVLIDKGVHASFYDGIKQSKVNYTRFRQHDMQDFTAKLANMQDPIVAITESIFSMSGHLTPLNTMATLSRQYKADLVIDEAHAFGIMGPYGMGAAMHFNLTMQDIPLRIIPLGKAFAASGAIIAGKGLWIEALLQTARSYIYSTGISPAFAYGILKTLEIIRKSDARREQLTNLIDYFRTKIQDSPFIWRDSLTPIQQLQVGCPHRALQLAQYLETHGIICRPMRQPTVSLQETGLRIILNANHKPEDLDKLFACLI